MADDGALTIGIASPVLYALEEFSGSRENCAHGLSLRERETIMTDNRDAEAIFSSVVDEFRRALQAERDFLTWRAGASPAFDEHLRRNVECIEACEPWARSYRRISPVFPEHIERLQDLLFPIQQES